MWGRLLRWLRRDGERRAVDLGDLDTMCQFEDCPFPATANGYCRHHQLWPRLLGSCPVTTPINAPTQTEQSDRVSNN